MIGCKSSGPAGKGSVFRSDTFLTYRLPSIGSLLWILRQSLGLFNTLCTDTKTMRWVQWFDKNTTNAKRMLVALLPGNGQDPTATGSRTVSNILIQNGTIVLNDEAPI